MSTRSWLRALVCVPLLIGSGGVATSLASADDTTEPEVCARQINWSTTSHIKPGELDVTRDPKTITDDGDVAIDGWTVWSKGRPAGGVDAWGDGMRAQFRVVVGTTVPLTNV